MRLCQAFADEGHTVTLSGIKSASNMADPIRYYGLRGGFRVARYDIGGFCLSDVGRRFLWPGLVMAIKTRPLIRECKPQIIYSRLTLAELFLVPRNIPIVYEMHSLGPLGSRILRPLFLSLVRRKNFRRIIVTTDALMELLRAQLPEIEITVARLSAEPPIPVDAVEMDQFKNDVLQGTQFKYHVGYTGYLDTYGLRGTEIICQAAASLPHVAFHIVGGEPDIVDHWRSFAKKHNQGHNIFFYGYRNPSEMPFFLNAFDVTLAPLQHRPNARAPIGQNMSPLKLPQYLGYGKAIVASDIPAHRETLTHNETAILVPHDNVSAWVRAIEELLDHPGKRELLGQNGRAAYREHFTPSIRVTRILDGISGG